MTRCGLFIALVAVVTCAVGCGSIPPNRYGVTEVNIEGAESFSEDAIQNCLGTRERPHAEIQFGVRDAGACGEEPFTSDSPIIPLWTWPWTDWPLLDRVVVERDVERIERWYEARGHHQARVTELVVDPPQALSLDVINPEEPTPGCERIDDDEGCLAEVTFQVEEGEPTLVASVELSIEGEVPDGVRAAASAAIEITEGERFDEAHYQRAKAAVSDVFLSASYLAAEIHGTVRINRPTREARIELRVRPGPPCVFGEVHIDGEGDLPRDTILAATGIREGERFDPELIEDAQRAVFRLQGFSSVLVEPMVPEEGNVVDVTVSVRPARTFSGGLGIGVQSGVIEQNSFETASVPMWDIHLLATYTNRNFLGGLRQLQLEERPRLIVLENFPSLEAPVPGNLVRGQLDQPGFLEARTTLTLDASHDFGPDPYDAFFRHRVRTGLAISRLFLAGQRLFLSFGLRNEVLVLADGNEVELADRCITFEWGHRCTPREPAADFLLTYYEQVARLDLRDDARRPRAGVLLQLTAQEAGYGLPSSWKYFRLLPELRFYVPLFANVTLAARLAAGMLFVTSADADLPEASQRLGPRDHRLRGGGAASNRGFVPGQLGDGERGGTRRWELSIELRIPITQDFEVAPFLDMGDVHAGDTFRLDHPQMSVGLGFRLYTLVTLRLDLAWRVPGMQFLTQEDQRIAAPTTLGSLFGIVDWPGAVHISVGQPF